VRGKPLFDWKGALSHDTTALIYMPGTDYEGLSNRLCADGLPAEIPCLVISQATTKQQIHCTRLANLADSPHYTAPVLLIVGAVAAKYQGEVADLHTTDDWTDFIAPAFESALANERAEAWEA
jgi:siroheme synthase